LFELEVEDLARIIPAGAKVEAAEVDGVVVALAGAVESCRAG
jgi:hypothetical protein